jgi:hypothetical protein
VDVDDALDLLLGAHEDAAPVVDVLGDDLHHALHLTVDGEAAGCGGVLVCSNLDDVLPLLLFLREER